MTRQSIATGDRRLPPSEQVSCVAPQGLNKPSYSEGTSVYPPSRTARQGGRVVSQTSLSCFFNLS